MRTVFLPVEITPDSRNNFILFPTNR